MQIYNNMNTNIKTLRNINIYIGTTINKNITITANMKFHHQYEYWY